MHSFQMIIPVLWVFALMWIMFQSWRRAVHTETIHPYKSFVLLLMYYGCYLVFGLQAWAMWQWYNGSYNLHQLIVISVISAFIIYARFIEPNTLAVKHHSIRLNHQRPLKRPVKVALIADVHIGLFSGRAYQLRKIVKKINRAQPDFILVAGDWTYEPDDDLIADLSDLKQFDAPVYSVNGNHDEQYPGPPIQTLLNDALACSNIETIEGKIIEFDEFRLYGVGDLWADKIDFSALEQGPQDKPWLILAHNPDTVDLVPKLASYPLMLAGHTHGGQIEVPWLTSYVMQKISILGYKKGLYQHENAQVFVTVGTGMVGAPFRFRVPPTVDILHLS